MAKDLEEVFEDETPEAETFIPYQSPTGSVEDVIRMLESCPLCGAKMHFTNFSDFARMVSHEVCRCEECGYRAKKDMSQLQ